MKNEPPPPRVSRLAYQSVSTPRRTSHCAASAVCLSTDSSAALVSASQAVRICGNCSAAISRLAATADQKVSGVMGGIEAFTRLAKPSQHPIRNRLRGSAIPVAAASGSWPRRMHQPPAGRVRHRSRWITPLPSRHAFLSVSLWERTRVRVLSSNVPQRKAPSPGLRPASPRGRGKRDTSRLAGYMPCGDAASPQCMKSRLSLTPDRCVSRSTNRVLTKSFSRPTARSSSRPIDTSVLRYREAA